MRDQSHSHAAVNILGHHKPSSGTITVGGTVTITVTAANNQTGLTASNATINTRSVRSARWGTVSTAAYNIQSGDPLGVNINATG